MHSKNQKRHGSPIPSRSPLVPMKPKVPAVAPAMAPSPGDTLPFRVPKDYPHSRFSKAPLAVYPPKGTRNKTCVSLPVVTLEKMTLSRADSASHMRLTSSSPSSSSSSSPSSSLKPSSLTPSAYQRSGEKLTNGRSSSRPSTPRSTTPLSSLDCRPSPARSPLDRQPSSMPSPSPMDRKPSPSSLLPHRTVSMPPSSSSSSSSSLSSSPGDKKHQNGTKASCKSHKRLSGRVFDPNKHCGVQDPETKRPCTRSLTCKTHSLTHRRAVPGRRKNFDILLAEHKGRAKEKDGEKEKERERERDGAKEGGGQSVPSQESPSKPQCPNGRPLSMLKLRLANAHIPRAPGGSTSSGSAPSTPAPAPAPNPELSPLGWATAVGDSGRLSSDEGEAETPEDVDRPAFHFSNHHPQPLGFCVFSSRLMGRGHYVFDRRWDRMRLALQSMVEKHVNSQMWRKVPLAADSLLSTSGPSSGTSQPTSSPTSVASPSSSPSYTATFPQSTTTAGVFSIRDTSTAQAHTPIPSSGKARNSTHRPSRPSKDTDSDSGSKKRKNSSYFSSSPSSPSSSFVEDEKRNGSSSYHLTSPCAGSSDGSPAKKKGLGHGGSGLWHSGDDWLSRSGVSQGVNSQSSSSVGSTSFAYSSKEGVASTPHQTLAPPSGPLAYGGGVEGRKRRSPGSYRGKGSKLSKPGGLESIFGKGNEIGGILASGPEPPRQAKLHH